jgi:predicted small lipoprotein YifL
MRRNVFAVILALLAMSSAGCGLSRPTLYPGNALTADLQEAGVLVLGSVEACRGAFCPAKDGEGGQEWPLTLSSVPPISTYHAALRKRAAAQYHVAENEVRLGEVRVGYYRELDGTVTGWKANALAGRQLSPVTQ